MVTDVTWLLTILVGAGIEVELMVVRIQSLRASQHNPNRTGLIPYHRPCSGVEALWETLWVSKPSCLQAATGYLLGRTQLCLHRKIRQPGTRWKTSLRAMDHCRWGQGSLQVGPISNGTKKVSCIPQAFSSA